MLKFVRCPLAGGMAHEQPAGVATRVETDAQTAGVDGAEAGSEVASTGGSAFGGLKVAVLVVAYEAERHIGKVLARLGPIAGRLADVYVIDDASSDHTYDAALAAGRDLGLDNLHVFRTPSNRGYGGNQKVGYRHAIASGYDVVVLLHGDGQYPPEMIPELVAPFADPSVHAVLGSRMMKRGDALRGGMPLYKWVGNQVLTRFENRLLSVNLSEFHTGFRAYRVSTLGRLPFEFNSDGFHFDTEILIQLFSAGLGIVEVPIPTRYGDEICHVNGVRYAWDCVKSVISYRLFKMGLFYNPFLDFSLFDTPAYFFKHAANSLHQFVLRDVVQAGQQVLDLGASSGYVSAAMAGKGAAVLAVDLQEPQHAGTARTLALDLDGPFDEVLGESVFDVVTVLDVIEHLDDPEAAVRRIARVLKPGGLLAASTANISYFLIRLMLLLGLFNYGKRGILDKTHKRLFTVSSFKRLLRTYGYEVTAVRGFGPPIRDLISTRWPYSMIDSMLSGLARAWPGLFAYNFLVLARRRPSLDEVYRGTVESVTAPGA